jgi:hypothetical protein
MTSKVLYSIEGRWRVIVALISAIGWFSRLFSSMVPATRLHRSDRVVLFTTAARLTDDGKMWICPIHGWVHQPAFDSLIRQIFLSSLVWFLGLPPDGNQAQTLRQRLGWFLVDNKRKRRLKVLVGHQRFDVGPSDLSGHFRAEPLLEPAFVQRVGNNGVLEIEVLSPNHPDRTFVGMALLLPPVGLSVISDVDDTVKDSCVLNKIKLLENTFLMPYQAVTGMANAYRCLADKGATFHFVSCSPWHLYPTFDAFLTENGFPSATMTMKRLRLKDSSMKEFLSSPEEFKVPRIFSMIRAFPHRQFLLIGDSGEKDPEVYGQIARLCPNQVIGIFIRNVTGESVESVRLQSAFREVPAGQWKLFTDARELIDYGSVIPGSVGGK